MLNSGQIGVIGAGVAGLSFAIYMHEKNPELKVHVFSKTNVGQCNTQLAQGGIASSGINKNDSLKSHIRDTFLAGQKKGNLSVIETTLEEAPHRIQDLIDWGVKFDLDGEGFDLHKEGGHHMARILHCKDQTGWSLHQVLLKKAKECHSIHIHEFKEVIDIIQEEDRFRFEIIDSLKQQHLAFQCHAVVIATGGCGQLFPQTTNTLESIGDGIYLAQKLNLEIKDFSKIQFHPTAFKHDDLNPSFLISEAARGLGAHLVNDSCKRFMFKHHPKGELATRDVVTNAIWKEINEQGNSDIYLDFRHLEKEHLKNALPFIYKTCLGYGYDLCKDLIPIQPVAHYQCGGIKVDKNGETSMKNVFALGECACTGLHGYNRLASNSLLEALVFAKRTANRLFKSLKTENKGLAQEFLIANLYRFSDISQNERFHIEEFIKNIKDIALRAYQNPDKILELKLKLAKEKENYQQFFNSNEFHQKLKTLEIISQNVQLFLNEIDNNKSEKTKNILTHS